MTNNTQELSTLNSVPFTVCNVPDPISVSAQFVYNFYLENEDREYSPRPVPRVSDRSALLDVDTVQRIEQGERGSLTARVPRLIKIQIQKNVLGLAPAPAGTLTANQSIVTQASIPTNQKNELERGMYLVEGVVENKYIAKMIISDADVKQRLQKIIYRASLSYSDEGGLSGKKSDTQLADTLSKLASDEIDTASIIDALSDNTLKGVKFSNQLSSDVFNRLDRKTSIDYPTKFSAGDYRILTSQISRANPFTKNFLSDLLSSSAKLIAPLSIENPLLNSNLVDNYTGQDISTMLPQIRPLSITSTQIATMDAINRLPYPQIRHVGYVVEKVGISPQNEVEKFPDFVSVTSPQQNGSPELSEFLDVNVKYGYTYVYKARQLYLVDHLIVDPSGRYNIATVAIASSATHPATVKAEETTPPLPPGVLFCSFLYREEEGIRLDWCPPSNPPRDLRKYQVFRRASIQDPFEIIAEYDFTDEEYTQFTQREDIDPTIVTRTISPRLHHIDTEFSRESSFIYTVGSVDAHGFVSNYGVQIEAQFNRFTNKLSTRVVSRSGAPKSYPNYYINPQELEEFNSDRLIEDVIRDSGHGRMRLYFNPDAYKVLSDVDGTESEPIVLSRRSGVYKFQIINLDRQINKTLSVTIEPPTSIARLM